MPKKRHTNLFSKPPSTVHHSPTSSLSATSSGSTRLNSEHEGPKTVNELLSSLRTTHITPQNRGELPVNAPSLPTPIRQLLDLPDTPAPRPRVRTGAPRFGADGRRLPAGPAPPQSWLETSIWATATPAAQKDGSRARGSLEQLPGVAKWPAKQSLLGMVLKRISLYWEFHKEYDQHYLAVLPTPIRTLLLSYLAIYGPEDGLDFPSLKHIMEPDEERNDFEGNDDFDRLDLAGSLGRGIGFKNIKSLITSPSSSGNHSEQEDWDTTPAPIPKTLSTKITTLRYLSLSHPQKSGNLWASFLSIAPLLPTLTHLSLGHWPTPELTPNAKAATMQSIHHRSFDYGGTGFYAHTLDQDWSEAAGVLRRLSSSLYSLEWLDLDGCSQWVRALRWSKTPGIDWIGKWGRIRTLKLRSDISIAEVSKSETPLDHSDAPSKDEIVKYKLRVVEAMEVEKWIRQLRGWIDVQYDNFEAYDEFLDPRNGREEARVLNRQMLNSMKTAWVSEGLAYERRLRSSWDDES